MGIDGEIAYTERGEVLEEVRSLRGVHVIVLQTCLHDDSGGTDMRPLHRDTLNRIESMLEEKRDKAAGRSRVAITSGGIDPSGELLLKEAEMDAMNDAALAEFLSMNGMAPSSQLPQSTSEEDPLAVPQRGMGSME